MRQSFWVLITSSTIHNGSNCTTFWEDRGLPITSGVQDIQYVVLFQNHSVSKSTGVKKRSNFAHFARENYG